MAVSDTTLKDTMLMREQVDIVPGCGQTACRACNCRAFSHPVRPVSRPSLILGDL